MKEATTLASIVILIVLSSMVSASTYLISDDPLILALSAGNIYAKQQDYDKASAFFSEALTLDPDNEVALHNLGIIAHEIGNAQRAEQFFLDAIKANSEYGKAQYSLGLLYFHQSRYTESIEHFEKVVEIDDSDPYAHFDLGVAYVERFREKEAAGKLEMEDLSDLERGLEQYRKTLDLDAQFRHASQNAAIVQEVLNHYSDG